MTFELTGKNVSTTYLNLVQEVSGNYYNGAGNLLNIVDASSTIYIKDASLSDDFYWNNGYLEVSTGFSSKEIRAITTKINDYIVTTNDATILADASSNTVTITLPAIPVQGQVFNIKCINDANTCTVARNGNNLDGSTNDRDLLLTESITVQFDSIYGWAII